MSKNIESEIARFQVPTDRLEFTGERFTSGQGGPIEHEHRHRYLIAASICRGKDVLDIASGEGFGSAFLSTIARSVIGVDIDAEAITFARRNYQAENLTYREGSTTAIPLENASVDVVVSFETIEHFHDHETFMLEAKRVLRPGGVILISSPNKGIYEGSQNHFHVRELTQGELIATLKAAFTHTRLFVQKTTTGSIVAPIEESHSGQFRTFLRVDDFSYEKDPALIRPIYSLILASDSALPSMEWGVLDDEGYVGFLQRWIADADAHHTEIINSISGALDQAKNELELKKEEVSAAERENARQRLTQARDLARTHLNYAKVLSEDLLPAPKASEWHNKDAGQIPLELEAAQRAIAEIKASTSWRVSAPIRAGRQIAARAARGLRAVVTSQRVHKLERTSQTAHDTGQAAKPSSPYELPAAPPSTLAKRVLLVAETSMQQCAKYRVWQKKNAIESLGYECTVVNWGEGAKVRRLIQTHAAVIFYRVPGWPESLAIMHEARRLGIPTFWEVDDLIFDMEVYKQNKNLDLLTPQEKESILFGVPLFRDALLACGSGIASTETIARHMLKLGAERVFVVQNALDYETLRIAATLERTPQRTKKTDDEIVIFYGSGSRSHDADFREASEALERLMISRPQVRLRIAGALELPPSLVSQFKDRIERLPTSHFETYLGYLQSSDISIAPLEPSVFNDAKSNIKFLEASILGIPSVCSSRKTFVDAVKSGESGLLADSPQEWFESLARLCDDPLLRQAIGERARTAVREAYDPAHVTAREVAPLLALIPEPERKSLNVLTANIYFEPQSFGGATVVCEQLVQRLSARPDTSVAVFTSLGANRPDYDLVRYQASNAPAFAVKMPAGMNRYLEYENYRMAEMLREVLDAVKPDVVHMHSIQGLSASIADACVLADIPYVITLHDAWWICERQFMVDHTSRYCAQQKIDLSVCARCVPSLDHTRIRRESLYRILNNAALLLTPSEFQRQLYVSNGASPDRIRVNRNGVARPVHMERTTSTKLRFGFVGGIGGVKGFDLIRKAFEELEHTDYELVLVDNTMNIGMSSMSALNWKIKGTLNIRPAYSQSELDAFFSNLDVLLFPSQCKESFGLTVREALIRDVWVITTDAGGVVEDIQPGVNGDVLPFTSDHRPLRDAIKALLDSPQKLANFRNPLADQIRTYDGQADELHAFLKEVVQNHAEMMETLEIEKAV